MAQAPVFELPFNSDLAFQNFLAACLQVGKADPSSRVYVTNQNLQE
jgi:hypothetical protein